MSVNRSFRALPYIVTMALTAVACLAISMLHWQPTDSVQFTCYLIAALLASRFKVSLPEVEGTLSVNFLFTLLGILELNLPETVIIGLTSTLVQFYWKPTRELKPVQLVFNLSQVTVSTSVAYWSYHFVVTHVLHAPGYLALFIAAVTHFAFNTAAMSTIIGLTEDKPIFEVWAASFGWSFQYYLVGGAVAALINFLNRFIGWQSSLMILPPIYLMYRSYRLYLGKLEDEKRHAQLLSGVHLRTIETLALAIEAKDKTTGEHLQRVRVYAMELARELLLSDSETEALRAASVLHDIGKLAVPEHIISKPGKLTPEEFEQMKVHPIVGAEILEHVNFPYPVVPIVRAHHEKWDGSGYPYGLAGDQIPIGARILSAVDCLDAMASDRQYRKAMPLPQVIDFIVSQSGKSYDPQVVKILARRYVELEHLAKKHPAQTTPKLSTDIKVERGAAPGVGFAESAQQTANIRGPRRDSADLFSRARQSADELVALAGRLSNGLTTKDYLTLLAVRVASLIPYEAFAVYRADGTDLIPEYVSGANSRALSSLRIPVGLGLAGWVAQNCKSILNGNPEVEPGFSNDSATQMSLRSALAVPLGGTMGTPAVLVLYRAGENAFSEDELTVIELIGTAVGTILQAAAKPHAVRARAAAE